MRRYLIGLGVMALLVGVLGLTSGFRLAADTPRVPAPSEFGMEQSERPPFEFGSVSRAQSFR